MSGEFSGKDCVYSPFRDGLVILPFRKQRRAAFTLIELSVVLVIIGLIIGGVLTGQQIIQNARITNSINAMQSYQAQVQTYSQNYGALPGDDSGATKRFPNNTAFDNGQGDGTVGNGQSYNTMSVTPPAGESRLIWSHLRAAGLVKNQTGDTGNAIQPQNPFSGIFGFQNGAFNGVFTTTVLCMDKVPSDAAQTIDTRLDDGQHSTGTIQSSTGAINAAIEPAAAANSTGYVAGGIYTMCMRI